MNATDRNQHIKALPSDAETKAFDWEIKASDDPGQLLMYVAYFNNIDRTGDVIAPGAFKSLDEFLRTGWLGINHAMDAPPIGFPVSAVQDEKGLLCKFQFHSTPEAQSARTIIQERLRGLKSVSGSIGYRVRPGGSFSDHVDGKSVRKLTDVELFETSWVNLPANPRAEAISAKSLEGQDVDEKIMTIDALKQWLDAEVKRGRVLSKENHGKLKAWHGTLSTMCNDMKGLVDMYDPDRDEDQDQDKDKANVPPPSPSPDIGKDATPQRRAAGNSIPADQNPRGAIIAEDIPGKSLAEWQRQREQQLEALRQRVLKDQFRFARS